ncbi:MAG: UbiA-like polyprenyltransferase [Planctomycetota bacterium]
MTEPPTPSADASGSSVWTLLSTAASDIKLAHTVFALPFALLGAGLAFDPSWGPGRLAALAALIVGCMFFARTWAMLFNRIVDARFDAANPRTAGRAVASGRLGRRAAWTVALSSACVFTGLCAVFLVWGNHWPALMSVPVLAWIALYSLTKRFTLLCHVFLGGALAASPVCAAVAVRPEVLSETPVVWWLAGMVLAWVAGFDVIYALQDRAFDRETGLHSIPAKLGARRAIWISRVLHVAAFGALVAAWQSEPRLEALFGVAVGAVGVLLIVEHAVLARRGEAGLQLAFFTLNGVVSVVLGVAGLTDLVV